jgi:hypothetical protein
MTTLVKFHSRLDAIANIIYVHGLNGGAEATWRGNKNDRKTSWPGRLIQDRPELNQYSLDFDAASSRWIGRPMTLQDRAINLLKLLEIHNVMNLPTAFVVHSLGGLIFKQMLRHAREVGRRENLNFLSNTKLVFFASTPHQGAKIASIVKRIPFARISITIRDLEANNGPIRDLFHWFQNLDEVERPAVKVIYETKPTWGVLVVEAHTADVGIPSVTPTPLDVDHFGIIRDETAYHILLDALEKHLVRKTIPITQDAWLPVFEAYSTAARQLWGYTQMHKMSQPISVDSLFTQVRVYAGSLADRLTQEEILKRQEKRDYNLPDAQDALEVARQHPRLFVVGAPGAGKTTFMKHLMLMALEGKLGEDTDSVSREKFNWPLRIENGDWILPFIVPLREWWRERDRVVTLEAYIERSWNSATQGMQEAPAILQRAWISGRVLVLLDGLDEIPTAQKEREVVIGQIEALIRENSRNRFVLTCRTAAADYKFPYSHFMHVEIADFDEGQIESFVGKWFTKFPEDGISFQKEVKKSENLKEVARSPLLLALMCWLYQQRRTVYTRRTEIYETALTALLEEWDGSRRIERDEIYRGLQTQRKHELFSEIAEATFEDGQIVIPNNTLISLVERFLTTLPRSELEAGLTENERRILSQKPKGIAGSVLKAIAEQHGVIIERVGGWHAFSHLTFHEFYLARAIVNSDSEDGFHILMRHIHEDRWNEVILLVANQLTKNRALKFISLWKLSLNEIISSSKTTKDIFKVSSLNIKECSARSNITQTAFRAYLCIILNILYQINPYCNHINKLMENPDLEKKKYFRNLVEGLNNFSDILLALILDYGRIFTYNDPIFTFIIGKTSVFTDSNVINLLQSNYAPNLSIALDLAFEKINQLSSGFENVFEDDFNSARNDTGEYERLVRLRRKVGGMEMFDVFTNIKKLSPTLQSLRSFIDSAGSDFPEEQNIISRKEDLLGVIFTWEDTFARFDFSEELLHVSESNINIGGENRVSQTEIFKNLMNLTKQTSTYKDSLQKIAFNSCGYIFHSRIHEYISSDQDFPQCIVKYLKANMLFMNTLDRMRIDDSVREEAIKSLFIQSV